jgi:hypothetical protein
VIGDLWWFSSRYPKICKIYRSGYENLL